MSPLKKRLLRQHSLAKMNAVIFDGHGEDAADGLAESFDEIVVVAAAAFPARN
jgi:hypothetical protein